MGSRMSSWSKRINRVDFACFHSITLLWKNEINCSIACIFSCFGPVGRPAGRCAMGMGMGSWMGWLRWLLGLLSVRWMGLGWPLLGQTRGWILSKSRRIGNSKSSLKNERASNSPLLLSLLSHSICAYSLILIDYFTWSLISCELHSIYLFLNKTALSILKYTTHEVCFFKVVWHHLL